MVQSACCHLASREAYYCNQLLTTAYAAETVEAKMDKSRSKRLSVVLGTGSVPMIFLLMVGLVAGAGEAAAQDDPSEWETGAVCVEDRVQKNIQCTCNDFEIDAGRSMW